MEILNQVEMKIKDMTTAASNFEIKADITQLEADVARIKAEIGAGAVMPITLAPIAAGGGTGAPQGSGATGEFYGGGFTGWRGRSQIAGVVHGMEYVTPAGVTLQPGVIPFLEALRRYGNKVLPGYAAGGLVTATRSNTATVSRHSSGATVNLSLDGNTYSMSTSDSVAASLITAVRREALRKGKR
jgi:hypothetical protein